MTFKYNTYGLEQDRLSIFAAVDRALKAEPHIGSGRYHSRAGRMARNLPGGPDGAWTRVGIVASILRRRVDLNHKAEEKAKADRAKRGA